MVNHKGIMDNRLREILKVIHNKLNEKFVLEKAYDQEDAAILTINSCFTVVLAALDGNFDTYADIVVSYDLNFLNTVFDLFKSLLGKELTENDLSYLNYLLFYTNFSFANTVPFSHSYVYKYFENGFSRQARQAMLTGVGTGTATYSVLNIHYDDDGFDLKSYLEKDEKCRKAYSEAYKKIKEWHDNLTKDNIELILELAKDYGFRGDLARAFLKEQLKQELVRKEQYKKEKEQRKKKEFVITDKISVKPLKLGITIEEEKRIEKKRKQFLQIIKKVKPLINIEEYLSYVKDMKYVNSNKEMLWSELQELFPLIELDEEAVAFLEAKAINVGKKNFDVLELMDEINEVKLECSSSVEEDALVWQVYLEELYSKLKIMLEHDFNYEYELSLKK